MIRLLYVLSALTLLSAGSVLGLWFRQRSQGQPAGDLLLERPGAIETFLQNRGGVSVQEPERLSPLMAQANILAAHLNPPAPVQASPVVLPEAPKPAPAAPVIRPVTTSPKFSVYGTSCCDERPERSMALIAELGSQTPARWVRSGTQVGHLVIQEIRPGSIVCLDGGQVQEMKVERTALAVGTATDSRSSSGTGAPTAAQTQPTPLSAPGKRPIHGKSMTVGSARTAALN